LAADEVILRTEDLCKYFGGIKALDHVNIHVRKGEILGIIGPNGAGKTTLFNVVSGFYKPTKGAVFFMGRRISGLHPAKIARIGIGRTFQITRPFKNLTVLQNVMAACGRDAYFGLSFFKKYRTPEVVEEAMSIIEDVGLADYADQPAKVLPIGHMRRLEIARALALRPKLLLLDEPTAGMSAKEIEEISELVRRLRDEKGITIMLVEHNMRVAMGLSDRMYVLNYGKVIAEGTPEEVRENPLVIEAYLGRGYAAGS